MRFNVFISPTFFIYKKNIDKQFRLKLYHAAKR